MAKKHPKNSNQILPLLTLSLVLALALLFFKQSRLTTPQPIQVAEVTNPTGSVTLSLSPSVSSLKPGDTSTISLVAETGSENLTAIDLTLTFDPTLVELSEITPHPDLPTIMRSPTITDDTLKFAYGISGGSTAILSGNLTLATFKLKALTVGSPTLSLSPTILVTTKEKSTNALKEINNLVLTIADNTTTSTPPSSSPSIEPSVTPSVTPSPAPSASPLTKPNSPVNLKYNCYSNGTRITLRWDAVTSASGYEVVLDQKDGSDDQTKSTTRSEIDLDIHPNTTYSWKVMSVNNNQKSDPTTVSELKCTSTSSTPTPTPSATKKPLSQAIKNVVTPKSPTPSPSYSPASPTAYPTPPVSSPGSLSDIFGDNPDNQTSPSQTDKSQHSLFTKIVLGWRAIFLRLVSSFGN